MVETLGEGAVAAEATAEAPVASKPLYSLDDAENAAAAPVSNGHSAEGNGMAGGNGVAHESNAASCDAGVSAEEVEVLPAKWAQRMWFVRMPKPPEDTTLAALDQEFESLRMQYQLLNESMNLKKMEKEAAEVHTRRAQEAFDACVNALREKEKEMQPLRDAYERRKVLFKDLNDLSGDLLVKTEAELDRQLAEIDHRTQHESLTLNEEKKELARAKKLASQRERVKEYAAKQAVVDELKVEIKELEEGLKGVDADRKVLQSEKETAKVVRDKFREEERAIGRAMKEVYDERQAVRDLKDAAYERMVARKSGSRSKVTDFYENRRFSRTVRELLAAGKQEEARSACAVQMEEAHARLSEDDEFHAEYIRLWSQQLGPAYYLGEEEEEPEPAGGGDGGGRARAPKLDPEAAKARAEAVIAATLAQARVKPAPAPEAAPASEAAPADVPKTVASAPAARPVKRAAKPKAQPVPELPAALAAEDTFEIPEFAKAAAREVASGGGGGGGASDREASRAAAAEAQRRQEKKRAEREKKRLRAAEAAARAAAEKAKAVAAAALAAAPAVAVPASAEEEGGEAGAVGGVAASSALQEPAAATVDRPVQRGAGAVPKGVSASQRGSRARAPPRRKGLKQLAKQYELYIIAAVGVLFLATLVHLVMNR